jgi:hypothetical protein
VLLEIRNTCAGDRRAWFCEKDAADFERNCWTHVEAGAGEQMTLDLG